MFLPSVSVHGAGRGRGLPHSRIPPNFFLSFYFQIIFFSNNFFANVFFAKFFYQFFSYLIF